LPDRRFDGAPASCFPREGENEPRVIVLLEEGFECLPVILHQPNKLLGDAQAEQPQFAKRSLERLGLPKGIPFADNRLQVQVGVQREFICAGADLHGRVNRVIELLPASLQ
jgi:hypothetical protein